MTMRDALDRLDPSDRDRLSYALEAEISQQVSLGDNEYIGVNCHVPSAGTVINEVGDWLHWRED